MAMGNGEKTGKSTNWPGLSLFLAAMGSECRFRSIKLSVYGQKRKCENVSVAAEQPLRSHLDENGALMWTRLDNVPGVSLLFAALQRHVPRLLKPQWVTPKGWGDERPKKRGWGAPSCTEMNSPLF